MYKVHKYSKTDVLSSFHPKTNKKMPNFCPNLLASKKWMNQKMPGAEKLRKVNFAEILYQKMS